MHWNYRVVEDFDDGTGERTFGILAVYYDEKGTPVAYATTGPMAGSMSALHSEVAKMVGALDRPILKAKDIDPE